MKLSYDFSPQAKTQEHAREAKIEADGKEFVFLVKGAKCKAMREFHDRNRNGEFKDAEEIDKAFFDALVIEVPKGIELEDGTKLTKANMHQLIAEQFWLLEVLVKAANSDEYLNPKP